MCLCFWICTYLQYISIHRDESRTRFDILNQKPRPCGIDGRWFGEPFQHSCAELLFAFKTAMFSGWLQHELEKLHGNCLWLLVTSHESWTDTQLEKPMSCKMCAILVRNWSNFAQKPNNMVHIEDIYRKMRGETKKFRNWKNEWIKWCLRTSVVAAFCWLCRSCASFGANQKSSCWNLPSLCRSMATWDVHRWTWGWVPRIRALRGLMATKLSTNNYNYGGNHRCLLQGLESATPNFVKVQILENVVNVVPFFALVKVSPGFTPLVSTMESTVVAQHFRLCRLHLAGPWVSCGLLPGWSGQNGWVACLGNCWGR